MIWLVVFGLGFWCFHQQQKLGKLTEQLVQLSREIALLTDRASRLPTVETVQPAAISETVKSADLPDEAVLAATPATPEREMTPPLEPDPAKTALPWTIPERAAPVVVVQASPEPDATLLEEAPAEPEPAAVPESVLKAAPPPEPPRPVAPPLPPGPSISEWLAENGLAWIGGGALALGGLLLVAYAAQRGFFTPALRIFAAVILGLAALGVGEALRRGVWAKSGPNQLVAALTTAAGAATLYAAIWAADLLYRFISPGEAGALLAAVSLGLLALALLHGEALGLLAIIAAYLVPVVTGGGAWGGGALDGFVVLILATGLAIAGLRSWTRAGAFALAGAGLWALERFGGSDRTGASLIASAAPLLALAAALYARRSAPSEPEARRPFELLPGAAVLGASVLALMLMVSLRVTPPQAPMAAVMAILLATALGVRAGMVAPAILWAPALALDAAALTASATTSWARTQAGPSTLPWILPALAAVALAGFDGARRSRDTRAAAVAGAAGTALALTLAAPALARDLPHLDVAIDAAFAVLFALGAALLARRSADARTDWTPAAFIAAAAEATGLALHASLDVHAAPTAYGLLALALAVLAVRIAWRGFAETAAVAALASLGGLLVRPVAGDALLGLIGPGAVIAACAPPALAQFAAWAVLRRRADVRGSIEAVSTTALVTALLGAFLALQTLARPHAGGAGLDGFTEASLRTLLLLAAGLMLAIRGAATPLGRARAPILLGLGAFHGLVLQGLLLHPWWGVHWGAAHPVLGPPLADGLMLGLLAPALLLLDAARRPGVREAKLSTATISAALAFVVIWLISEIRRLFHGPLLDQGPLGFSETAAYAAAALGLAVALDACRARLSAWTDFGRGTGDLIDGTCWVAGALALWLLGFIACPWWGSFDGDLHDPALLIALYTAGFALSAILAWRIRMRRRGALARAALIAAGTQVFVLAAILVRYAFHGAVMRAPLHEMSFAEAAAYPVAALSLALLLDIGRVRLNARAEPERTVGDMGWITWGVGAFALWQLAYVASPWWGPLDGDLQSPALLIALYIAGCGLSAVMAWRARVQGRAMLARASLSAAAIEVFALLSIVVRYAFHGAAMRAPLREASLETWTFSAAWALYGLLLLAVGSGRRDPALRALGLVALLGTTAKVFLFDLARLDGPIRAASFLALGVVLLMGALAARRFAVRAAPPPSEGAGQ